VKIIKQVFAGSTMSKKLPLRVILPAGRRAKTEKLPGSYLLQVLFGNGEKWLEPTWRSFWPKKGGIQLRGSSGRWRSALPGPAATGGARIDRRDFEAISDYSKGPVNWSDQ
jgi:hypothetical protein